MIGDKLLIKEKHTQCAKELCDLLSGKKRSGFSIAIFGESGSGKSEMAHELAFAFGRRGQNAVILQQDDYFVHPPKTNNVIRKENIKKVGPCEVRLDDMDMHIRAFKEKEDGIRKPLVVFDEDEIITEKIDFENVDILIAEGTYTGLLSFVDYKVFIDRDFYQTESDRKTRARDKMEPFTQEVLQVEHEIISGHRGYADVVISPDLENVNVIE